MHRKLIAAALLATGLGCAPAMAQGAKPNDAQIAHIAYTAGNIDIAAAQQALKKSKNQKVRAFAQDMVRDHKAVNQKALALVKKLKVTPEDNPTSQALKKDADAKKLIKDEKNLLIEEGWISLQSESHPCEFRKVELKVLKKRDAA